MAQTRIDWLQGQDFRCGCQREFCACGDRFRTYGEVCVNCRVGYHVDENGSPMYSAEPDLGREMINLLNM